MLALSLLAGACGPVGARDVDGPRTRDAAPAPVTDARAALAEPGAQRLVAVERGAQGSRLVLVDEEGLRQRVLTESGSEEKTLDLMPAWSPDGRWIVFASSRERGAPIGERYSLWMVAALEANAQPVRLTHDASIDWMPTWTPDGRAIVFASTGASGSFDLWRLDLEPGAPPRPGKLTRLTSTATEDWHPAISPDGKRLAYVAVDGEVHHLMVASIDGSDASELTEGDEPCWAPDGTWIAYVAPAMARDDLDVWRIAARGGGRAQLIDDDIADEHTPRFSTDGCWLLATSLLRNATGQIVTSTLVVAPLCSKATPRWQGLVDVHPNPRLGVAVAPVPLRSDVLARAPDYKTALKRALLPTPDENE